jgi:hypothetical protein
MTTIHRSPRALRELRRALARIPPAGDFAAGRRLRAALRAALMEASAHPAPWTGALEHPHAGVIEIHKTSADELEIALCLTGDSFAIRPGGRRWDL